MVEQEDLALLQKIKVIGAIQGLVEAGPEGGDGEATTEVPIEYHHQAMVLGTVVAEGGLSCMSLAL
jgi:hypothetical protein